MPPKKSKKIEAVPKASSKQRKIPNSTIDEEQKLDTKQSGNEISTRISTKRKCIFRIGELFMINQNILKHIVKQTKFFKIYQCSSPHKNYLKLQGKRVKKLFCHVRLFRQELERRQYKTPDYSNTGFIQFIAQMRYLTTLQLVQLSNDSENTAIKHYYDINKYLLQLKNLTSLRMRADLKQNDQNHRQVQINTFLNILTKSKKLQSAIFHNNVWSHPFLLENISKYIPIHRIGSYPALFHLDLQLALQPKILQSIHSHASKNQNIKRTTLYQVEDNNSLVFWKYENLLYLTINPPNNLMMSSKIEYFQNPDLILIDQKFKNLKELTLEYNRYNYLYNLNNQINIFPKVQKLKIVNSNKDIVEQLLNSGFENLEHLILMLQGNQTRKDWTEEFGQSIISKKCLQHFALEFRLFLFQKEFFKKLSQKSDFRSFTIKISYLDNQELPVGPQE